MEIIQLQKWWEPKFVFFAEDAKDIVDWEEKQFGSTENNSRR